MYTTFRVAPMKMLVQSEGESEPQVYSSNDPLEKASSFYFLTGTDSNRVTLAMIADDVIIKKTDAPAPFRDASKYQLIGEGGFGKVYKPVAPDDRRVFKHYELKHKKTTPGEAAETAMVPGVQILAWNQNPPIVDEIIGWLAVSRLSVPQHLPAAFLRDKKMMNAMVNSINRIATDDDGRQEVVMHGDGTLSVQSTLMKTDLISYIAVRNSGQLFLYDDKPDVEKAHRRNRLALFRSMLYAVAYLHSNGVSHMDLKFAQFLVSSANDPSGLPESIKLTDFGAAFCWDTQHVSDMLKIQERSVYGAKCLASGLTTYMYAPPEMLMGMYNFFDTSAPELMNASADEKLKFFGAADIWSMGVMFVELFMGGPLFPFVDQKFETERPQREMIANHVRKLGWFPYDLYQSRLYKLSLNQRYEIANSCAQAKRDNEKMRAFMRAMHTFDVAAETWNYVLPYRPGRRDFSYNKNYMIMNAAPEYELYDNMPPIDQSKSYKNRVTGPTTPDLARDHALSSGTAPFINVECMNVRDKNRPLRAVFKEEMVLRMLSYNPSARPTVYEVLQWVMNELNNSN